MTASKPNPSPGEIRGDAVYTLEEFERRTQLGKKSLRTARRNGLAVHRAGRRSYVIGKDFIDYLNTQHRAQQQPAE